MILRHLKNFSVAPRNLKYIIQYQRNPLNVTFAPVYTPLSKRDPYQITKNSEAQN